MSLGQCRPENSKDIPYWDARCMLHTRAPATMQIFNASSHMNPPRRVRWPSQSRLWRWLDPASGICWHPPELERHVAHLTLRPGCAFAWLLLLHIIHSPKIKMCDECQGEATTNNPASGSPTLEPGRRRFLSNLDMAKPPKQTATSTNATAAPHAG